MSEWGRAPFPAAFRGVFPDRLYAWLECCPAIGTAEELHLQRKGLSTLTAAGKTLLLPELFDSAEFDRLLLGLLRGSPYAQEDRLRQGYFLFPGGYRVGVCGGAVTREERIGAPELSSVSSLCLRIPHRHPGIAAPLVHLLLQTGRGSLPGRGMLLYGPPGVGKTTLLRDLCEQLSGEPHYFRSAVIDDRGELFPEKERPGLNADIYAAWPKGDGLEAAIRTAAPQLLLCDELSDREALRLLEIGSGLPLIATAHAGSAEELRHRPGLGRLLDAGRFFCAIGLHRGSGGLGFCYRETAPAEVYA